MSGTRVVNRRGVAASMLLMLAGALLVIITSVNAIRRSSAEMYEDVAAFDVDLAGGGGSAPFRWKDKERLSLWLLVPDRSIEGRDAGLLVSVEGGDGETLARYRHNFRTATLRSETPRGYYYRIGSYKFFDAFDGRIAWQDNGDWPTDMAAQLVLRRNRGTLFTPGEVVRVIAGGLILMLGLALLFRAAP
ncbi:MAG TPA: hypothetical protein ENK05_11245 [Gammaproteobacteria bacterium]|nr:hypothetical protein [Gammaproteobacteria bacterium]